MNTRGKAFAAYTAVIEGDVTLGADVSVWHGAVIRADADAIVIGERTNVQDNAVFHVSSGFPCKVGNDVTIGHGAIIHGCEVGDGTLIGMGAIVLDGARIGRNCIIGAGSLVRQGAVIPDGFVAFGSPARVARKMNEDDLASNRHAAECYVRKSHEVLPAIAPTEQHAAVSAPDDLTSTPDTAAAHAKSKETTMNIRRAQTTDIADIARLLRQVCQVHADGRPDLFQAGGTKYTDAELAQIIADDDRPIFVAADEDEHVLGYAFCVVEDYTADTARTHIRSLYIDDICVDEAARGRHVGSAVYNHVIAWAREQGFYNVTLNVWSCNPGAQRFYEAMGMKPFKVGMEQVL